MPAEPSSAPPPPRAPARAESRLRRRARLILLTLFLVALPTLLADIMLDLGAPEGGGPPKGPATERWKIAWGTGPHHLPLGGALEKLETAGVEGQAAFASPIVEEALDSQPVSGDGDALPGPTGGLGAEGDGYGSGMGAAWPPGAWGWVAWVYSGPSIPVIPFQPPPPPPPPTVPEPATLLLLGAGLAGMLGVMRKRG